jgi:hypothetical protein
LPSTRWVIKPLLLVIAIAFIYCIFRTDWASYISNIGSGAMLALASVAAYLYRERHRLRRPATRPPLGSLERERLDIEQRLFVSGPNDPVSNPEEN